MMRKLGKLWLWIVYAFLFLPIFVVIVYSFNAAKYTSNWKGFTLKWYGQLFGNAALIDAVVNTLSVAALAASLATLLGVLAALCLKRTEFPGRQLLHASLYVLTVSPEMVMGISLLIFFISVKLPLGFVSMLIAHTTLGLPFVALTVLARLAEFDEHLVEAARDLGATEAQAFRYVILPVIMPAVVAGWLLAFTLSMDDVLISFFVAGPTFEVLPLRIYSMVRLGVKPDVNALSAIMFCVTIALVVLAFCLSRPRKSLRKGGKTFLKKSFSLPSPNPIPPFPKTFAFIESLFEKYGWHAGRVRRFRCGTFASVMKDAFQLYEMQNEFFRLCYRKWLMLFSLKLQRDKQKNALAVDPDKGKAGKKLYFSTHCGDETTTCYNRAIF